jgi:phage-related protein
MVPEPALKPIYWVASARKDLKAFPRAVQRAMGYALFRAQEGNKAPSAKPLKGIITGGGILEVVEDHESDTYRLVYTVRFADAIYVLHSFQKKSKKRIATPQREIALIRQRYEAARTHHESHRKD